MRTVHEYFTNKRMEDARFAHSWMVVRIASVMARVESMHSRQAESERQVENLFESLLAELFGDT